MPKERASKPDWRDAPAYAPLLGADRSLFAWEWLRRDPCYRAAFAAASSSARSSRRARDFGLVRFERPDLAVPDARPVWAAAVHPFVLNARPAACSEPIDLFDLNSLGSLATLAVDGRIEHLLISDGFRSVRLDAPVGTFGGQPVGLSYSLAGIESARPPLLTLQRFLALARFGRFSTSLHPEEERARRWVLMLRASDALESGAGQRDIARELLSSSVSDARWRVREPSVRSRSQRLANAARRMAAGAFGELLR